MSESLRRRLLPNTVIGERFTITRFLGEGAMGSVYAAEDRESKTPVALKVMFRDPFGDDPNAEHRFEREALLTFELDHPRIVKVFATDYDAKAQCRWIAMELVEGRSLLACIEDDSPLSPEEARSVLLDIFDAVAVAHARGIVHRDLKPENILVTRGPAGASPKVLDFGVAKSTHSDTAMKTRAGLGTPLWAAPEQGKEGNVPAPNADVWSLGLLAFYVLTGKHYWKNVGEGGSLFDLAMELRKSPIAPPSLRATEIGCDGKLPSGFDAWFLTAVHRDPGARHHDAGVALVALRKILTKAPPVPSWVPILTVAVIAAALTAVGAAVWFLR